MTFENFDNNAINENFLKMCSVLILLDISFGIRNYLLFITFLLPQCTRKNTSDLWHCKEKFRGTNELYNPMDDSVMCCQALSNLIFGSKNKMHTFTCIYSGFTANLSFEEKCTSGLWLIEVFLQNLCPTSIINIVRKNTTYFRYIYRLVNLPGNSRRITFFW